MNIQDSIIFFMEILGTIAFAASGAMVGIRKRMDIFGICVLGVVTAVGGGMTRDVILGKLPSALEKPVYVGVSVATALAIFILLYIKQDLLSGRLGTFYDKAMLGMDSVGLGIFTSLGVMSGIDNGYPDNTFLLVFIGMLTGVGGGLMRDMMAGEEPYIFRKAYLCLCLSGRRYLLRLAVPQYRQTSRGIYRCLCGHGDPVSGGTLSVESAPSENLVLTVAVFEKRR